MSISPPSEKFWWKEPIERVELLWVALALTWAIAMFLMMPYWHVYGKQNLSNEAYRTTPEQFGKKVEAMVAQYTVRKETDAPVPGGASAGGQRTCICSGACGSGSRSSSWRRAKPTVCTSPRWTGSTASRSSPRTSTCKLVPGYETVITVTPDKSGEFSVICNEYCGIGHHTMVGQDVQ